VTDEDYVEKNVPDSYQALQTTSRRIIGKKKEGPLPAKNPKKNMSRLFVIIFQKNYAV